jgi:Protein of unknown function (DUF2846)
MRYTSVLFISLLASLIGSAGCATGKPSPNSTTGFVPFTCPPDKALVYLYRVRRWHPDGNGIKMYVNETQVVSLHGREYCPLILDPGSTSLSHEYGMGPYGLMKTTMMDIQFQLEAGKTYYVAYRFWVNPFHHPNPTMILVDEATGTNEMSICSMRKSIHGVMQPQ